MFDIPLAQYVIVIVVMLVAGIVKGAIGMGLPLIGSSFLAFFFSPTIVLSIIAPTILVTNSMQAFRAGQFKRYLKQFWLFVVMMLIFMAITAYNVTAVSPRWIYFSLSIALVLFLLSQMKANKQHSVPSRGQQNICGIIAGLLAGIIGGLSSAWSPPAAIYFHWLNLSKDDFIRAMGWSFLIGSVPLNIGYVANGVINEDNFPLAICGLLTAMVAFYFGEKLRNVINEQLFKRFILGILAIMSVNFFYKFATFS